MCIDPVSATLTALSGIMQYQGVRSQADAYNQQAAANEQMARQVERQRDELATQAAREKEKLLSRRKVVEGQNTAALGAAGIDGATGMGLDLLAANYGAYNDDIRDIDYNQGENDYNLRVNVANYQDAAAASRLAAKSIKSSGTLNTILGTASSLYGNYRSFKGPKTSSETLFPAKPATSSAAATAAAPQSISAFSFDYNNSLFNKNQYTNRIGKWYKPRDFNIR